MEVIIVLFFLFLVSSLGESKKKAKQKRQAEQRVFRQVQEELEREQAEAARRMSAGEGEQHQTVLESEAAKRVAQAAAHQAVEAEIYRQVAFAHATEESSACTEDWQEEVRLHARPRPMGNRPMENKTPKGPNAITHMPNCLLQRACETASSFRKCWAHAAGGLENV